jgi:hypothetical protein
MLLAAVPVGDDRCPSRTIRRRDEKAKIPPHPKEAAQTVSKGNLMLRTIH